MIYDASALKKIKNRRNCRTAKIWGWILLVMGVMSLFGDTGSFELSMFITSLIFIVAGVLLLVTSIRKVRKWDKYESFINNHGNTPIPFLAEKMGLPPEKVRAERAGHDQQELFHISERQCGCIHQWQVRYAHPVRERYTAGTAEQRAESGHSRYSRREPEQSTAGNAAERKGRQTGDICGTDTYGRSEDTG